MIRALDDRVIAHQRKTWKREIELATRVLNAGWVLATNTTAHHPDGDARAGRVMLGLYAKILNNLLSIITLTQCGLPTGSVMREMTEALITLAYLATDPVPLAQQYLDGIVLRALKDLNRRRKSTDPEVRAGVREEDVRAVEERVTEIEARRSTAELEQMRRHGWASIPLEQMAMRAGLPPIVYEGGYAVDSRPTHAMDAADYLHLDQEENLGILLASGRTLNHLMPAIAAAIQAMDIINRALQLGHEKIALDLSRQMRELNKKKEPIQEPAPNNR